MFSLENIILPDRLESKLYFLINYSINFGHWAENIKGNDFTAIALILGFILVLIFRNSMEKGKEFKLNYKTALLSVICFICVVLSLNKATEFLYFNF